MNALSVFVGPGAAERLAREGWHPELFDGLVGASGGPKWLVLGHLDRALWQSLWRHRQRPLTAVGSSIGSWRHALLGQPDPIAAIDRFERAYLEQSYSCDKPTVTEITSVAAKLLRTGIGPQGEDHIVEHRWLNTAVVTARGRGWLAQPTGKRLALGLFAAALGNATSRRALESLFQRIIFEAGPATDVRYSPADFSTRRTPLTAHNAVAALMASAAIPYVFGGVTDPSAQTSATHWDGGIIDYHFDLGHLRQSDQSAQPGLWLYPHFGPQVTTGWFDKFLPWRSGDMPALDNVVLLCPSEAFIRQLPGGKIPDRGDFRRLDNSGRVCYWQQCVQASKQLAEDFEALTSAVDPLKDVVVLSQ